MHFVIFVNIHYPFKLINGLLSLQHVLGKPAKSIASTAAIGYNKTVIDNIYSIFFMNYACDIT